MKFKDKFLTDEEVSPNIAKTPEGYLLCKNVPISRVGEFTYAESELPDIKGVDGFVKITRTAEELFSEETIRSFEGKPVVIDHTEFATPQNWSDLSVGTVSNVRKGEGADANCLIADLLITKQEAIDIVTSNRMREVSCGYDAGYEDCGNGRGLQVGIVGNHVALVSKGRCGTTCRIKDSEMSKFEEIKALILAGKEDEAKQVIDALEGKTADEEEDVQDIEPDPVPEDDQPEEEKPDEGNNIAELLADIKARLEQLEEAVKTPTEDEAEEDEDGEEFDEDEEEEQPVDEEEAEEVFEEAEEIAPGIKKPVGDSAKGAMSRANLNRLKRHALKLAGVTQFGDCATLDGRALDIAFKAAVSAERAKRNPRFKDSAIKDADCKSVNEINKNFWNKR